MVKRYMKRYSTSLVIRIKSKSQCDISSYLLGWLLLKTQKIASVGKNMEKGNAPAQENSMGVSPQIISKATIWSSNSTSEYLSKENKNTNLKKYMHPSIHCSLFIVAKIQKQPNCSSLDEWITMWKHRPSRYYAQWNKSDRESQIMIWLTYGI